jgi:intracellular septation protein
VTSDSEAMDGAGPDGLRQGAAEDTAHERRDTSRAGERGRMFPRGFRRRLGRQLLSEVGPPILFFIAFMASDIYYATAVYAAAATGSVALSWAKQRRVPVLPLISTGLVLIFAGLTLGLDDATFIKIKPTVTNGFYAAVIGVGWLMGFRLIDRMLKPEAELDDAGLRALTWRVFAYLTALAIANEAAWRLLSTEGWVTFKVFGLIFLNLTFAAAMLPLVKRHLIATRVDEDAEQRGR